MCPNGQRPGGTNCGTSDHRTDFGKEFEDCSFAYRKGHSVKQAVYRIKEYYEKGFRWVVDADIDAFFDSVDHGLLLAKLRKYIQDERILHLIGLWLKAMVWDGESIKKIHKGIPQGSPISPILANLFLDELDEAFLKQGYRIIRFSDDFVVLWSARISLVHLA
ncbi:MAG: hypothetical protein HY787_29685, partial [Deltaproteobacteria bacterium]|nr:hypothetical protein [Deltaproteobacteria bacterium]